MDNHFHLVVETPRSNLSAGMQWLLGSYTQRFNRRHRLWGHLFGGRYKALLVDGRPGGAYLRRVCDYVHLNPVRAGMLSNKQKVHRYRWSSCTQYLTIKKKRPAWLRTDRFARPTSALESSFKQRSPENSWIHTTLAQFRLTLIDAS